MRLFNFTDSLSEDLFEPIYISTPRASWGLFDYLSPTVSKANFALNKFAENTTFDILGVAEMNGYVSGIISDEDDVDYYTLTITEPADILLLEDTSRGVTIVLYAPNGEQLKISNDRLRTTLDDPGDYVFSVEYTGDFVQGASRYIITATDYGNDVSANIDTESFIIAAPENLTGEYQFPSHLRGGRLDSQSDSDWHKVEIEAGKNYKFFIQDIQQALPTLALFDADGVQIDVDISYVETTSRYRDDIATFTFSSDVDVDVYMSVSGNSEFVNGEYLIGVQEIVSDVGDTPETAGQITSDTAVRGVFDTFSDRDWYGFDALAGDRHFFSTDNENLIVRIFDETGDLVEFVGRPNGRAPTVFDADGLYFISVNFVSDLGVGQDYELSVRAVADDYAGDATTTGRFDSANSSVSGRLEERTDDDWFGFEIEYSGQLMSFLISNEGTRLWTNFYLYDAEGNNINWTANHFDSSVPNSREYIFEGLAEGQYFVGVTGPAPAAGINYSIVSEEIFDQVGDQSFDANALEFGAAPFESRIETRRDIDVYGFTIEAGEHVRFDFSSTNTFGLAVGFSLVNSNGDVLRWNEIDLSTDLSRAYEYLFEDAGAYFVRASGNAAQYNIAADYIDLSSDIAGDISTHATIEVDGESVEGVAEYRADRDWYRFSVDAGDIVSFNRESNIFPENFSSDAFYIYDSSGDFVAQTGQYEFSIGGDYFISVDPDSNSNDYYSDYSIMLLSIEGDNVAGSFIANETIQIGNNATYNGTIDFFLDHDWLRFEVEGGQVYRFSNTIGTSTRNLFSNMNIYDSDGVEIEGVYFSDGVFQAPEDGVYFIERTGLTYRSSTPSQNVYTISSNNIFDDFSGNRNHATEVEMGNVIEGSANFDHDIDLFRVDLAAGQGIRISAVNPDSTNSQPYPPGSYLILNENMEVVASETELSRLTLFLDFFAEVAGTYFIVPSASLTGYTSLIPSYQFVVNELSGALTQGVNIQMPDGLTTASGTSLDDVIQGNNDDNILIGNDGNDTLLGRSGADIFIGGAGDDVMVGDFYNDIARYSGVSDNYRVIQLSESEYQIEDLVGNDGIDRITNIDQLEFLDGIYNITDLLPRYASNIQGDSTSQNLTGGDGDDRIEALGGDDVVHGGGGNDYLLGGDGDDELSGGEGADVVLAGAGDDFVVADHLDDIVGGAGYDTVTFSSSDQGVEFNLSVASVENVRGSLHDDMFGAISGQVSVFIDASSGDDVLIGSGFDDTLIGGLGNDRLTGGAGSDLFVFEGSSGVDVITDFDASDIISLDFVQSTTLSDIQAVMTDFSGYVVFNLSGGNSLRVNGVQSSDFALRNFRFTSLDETMIGNDNDNSLIGDRGANILQGFDGDDTLEGGGGADVLDGGAGSDTAVYETSTNRVIINMATDAASSGHATGDTFISIENITGSRFGDTITGDGGANIISGGAGFDVLAGFRGDDAIYGGEGNDFMTGGAGADIIDGGAGSADVARYVGSNAGVTIDLGSGTASGGHAEGDVLTNVEFLFGSSYNDSLTGDANNNWLFGANGDDTLDGAGGIDKFFGGAGADTFVFGAGDDFVYVTDFQNDIDIIDLSAYGFADLAEALSNFDQRGVHTRFFADGDTLFILNTDLADLMDDIVI